MVIATDPETGERGPRRVTDTIVGDGIKELVDIEIDGDVITATDGHPFWVDDEGRWVDAEDLQLGDVLLLADGGTIVVESVTIRVEVQRVHNLTVDGIHTYHVLADDSPVLVHNCRRPSVGVQRQAIDNATDEAGVLHCKYCGVELKTSSDAPNSLEFDHVVPFSHGGGRTIDNIVACCRTCNRSKGDSSLWDWLDL